jgi:hypothetical protein
MRLGWVEVLTELIVMCCAFRHTPLIGLVGIE